ncbi:MAG: chemotaxis protein CheW [Actinomycetota bacterium]|nr:chemotaxis protein CheW [Actinomycetota bacterium]
MEDEIVQEFVIESSENLDQVATDLVELERSPGDPALLSSIFRAMHTIKGTCGFLGYPKLEAVAHAAENLLSLLRENEITYSNPVANALLATTDAMREVLTLLETTGAEGDRDYSEIIATLRALAIADADDASPADVPATPAAKDATTPERGGIEDAAHPEPARNVPPPAEMTDQAHPGADSPEEEHLAGDAKAPSADLNIRVDVKLLDALMNLVGELVLARNQIIQYTESVNDPAIVATSQRLNLITTDLQAGIMKTRMQPIGNVLSKFPRVVRDLAQACGKKVRLETDGRETELDKTIIEAIKDPLTHLVRNSVDHGIETPEERLAAGKSEEGRLLIRAFHEGGQVNIEIQDDGAGIDAQKVLDKALDKGLVNNEAAAKMSDRELLSLIFLPGFSTAEKVTNVSGRGVGMDVVKTNIEKIGGTIDLSTAPGEGTAFKIKIPLTLAIVPALIVTSGGDRYAIPQVNLLELVRLNASERRGAVETISGTPTYRLRGKLLPLVDLGAELGVETSHFLDPDDRRSFNIVVLQADDRQFGLVVSDVNDTEEIVVKPLGRQLQNIRHLAGATIMGDGRVALILDVIGLARRANVVTENSDRAAAEATADAAEDGSSVSSLLIVRVGEDRQLAVPLAQVARLEEFEASRLEQAESRQVVQYRGRILPLIDLAQFMGVPATLAASANVPMVVARAGNRRVGLIVDEIVDIVSQAVRLQPISERLGVVGTAVVDSKVTSILDVSELVENFDQSIFEDEFALEGAQ